MELLQQQRKFFNTQQTKDLTFRKKALQRLEQEIEAREDAICDALYADFKKPIFESLALETQIVLAEIRLAIKKFGRWAKPKKVSASWVNFPSSEWIYKEPYGSILVIAPWNYPFQLALAPVIGAIAAGNTVFLKPSEMAPNTSAVLKEIIESVCLPEHVTVVEGGVEISQELLAQRWDYIFFTGSTQVGQIVYKSAAKHLTPVTLELGGKNPCIVDHSAKVKLAAKRIVWGKFINGGQTCIAPDYILVHKKVKGELIRALKKSITESYGSDIEGAAEDLARIINAKHYQRLKGLLIGEEILFGGTYNDSDNYLSPTLVNESALESKLMEDEIFGPILPIISYEDKADIEKYISRYGKPLAAYVFSKSKKFQDYITEAYSFGGGAINDTVVQFTNPRLPFGGVGSSGMGAYHGQHSFEVFSHHKSVVKRGNWIDPSLRYPPYNLPLKYIKMLKKFL
ncbi:aldehyde dehydrogenase [Flavobacteriaceae bacterium F89]|uniref:Aldehyde dehydrogenase n=1 Tax=Cerina litoralis TaxID=2874477 RepID=A0AAE3JP58_9FLAO|nr:aldehyde dehydrogenase [Cerina litoralis]MCG2461790.1 aldehyde dehydrogenase [Cerina litoralis]